jgi:hypothetical protein
MIEFLERYTVLNFETGIPNFKHSKELTEENFDEIVMNKDEDGTSSIPTKEKKFLFIFIQTGTNTLKKSLVN